MISIDHIRELCLACGTDFYVGEHTKGPYKNTYIECWIVIPVWIGLLLESGYQIIQHYLHPPIQSNFPEFDSRNSCAYMQLQVLLRSEQVHQELEHKSRPSRIRSKLDANILLTVVRCFMEWQ